MKKILSLFISICLLMSLFAVTASAAEEITPIADFQLPKPEAPRYMMFHAADRTGTEGSDELRVIAVYDSSVLELGAEWESDGDAFYEKYGLYSFALFMQFDTSLDGTDHWNHTPAWDTDYSEPDLNEATASQAVRSYMFEEVSIFDLYKKGSYSDAYINIADAVIQRDVPFGDYTFNNFYFDHENHSLYIRCRYYMEWETYDGETVGEKHSKVGEWSDVAIFGKNGNGITPEEPTTYEAPVISDLTYVPPGEGYELGHLTYIQATPEQVWNAGIYYEMTKVGDFEGLETEISINGGAWQPYNTTDAWGDWCLLNGARTASLEEPRIEADSNIKLRVRFLGTHGPSAWSNVLELNGGGTQNVPTETTGKHTDSPAPSNPQEPDSCSLCGFCPVPLGLCIFIWIAILLALIIIAVVIFLLVKPKKCKNCGEKLNKNMKCCPKCGTPTS